MESPGRTSLRRIISGGQTGVDRGALDAAIQVGIGHGGWCPQGRLSEDGTIPSNYELTETASADYPARTQQNVVTADGTLILFRQHLYGGTELTRRLADRHARPYLLVDLCRPRPAAEVRRWLRERSIQVLNVAGPRESSAPGIQAEARQYLVELLTDLVRAETSDER